MTVTAIRMSLEDLGARLFRRDHPHRRWRAGRAATRHDEASPEERALYRCFAVGEPRERSQAADFAG